MKGKPYRFTPEKQRASIALLAAGFTKGEVARALDVSTVTIWNAIKNSPDFAQQARKAIDEKDAQVEAALFKDALTPGNFPAKAFWLQNRQPDRWRDMRRHEFTGKEGKPIEVDVTLTIQKEKHLEQVIQILQQERLLEIASPN